MNCELSEPWGRCCGGRFVPRGSCHFLNRWLDRLVHPAVVVLARVPDLDQAHPVGSLPRYVKAKPLWPIFWPANLLGYGVVVLRPKAVELHDHAYRHGSSSPCLAAELIREGCAFATSRFSGCRFSRKGAAVDRPLVRSPRSRGAAARAARQEAALNPPRDTGRGGTPWESRRARCRSDS